MENVKSPSLYRTLCGMKDTFFQTARDLCTLANAETELAVKSFMHIALLSLLLRTLLFTFWISLCGGILVYLFKLQHNWMFSFMEIALLNLILLSIVGFYMLQLKNNFSFSATRKQLSLLKFSSEATHVAKPIKE